MDKKSPTAMIEKKKPDPPPQKRTIDPGEFRIKRQQMQNRGMPGSQQDSGHYEVHYRQSVFKPPNFQWYKRDKGSMDFKALSIVIQNGNEVCIQGNRVTKDEDGEVIETKKFNYVLIKI